MMKFLSKNYWERTRRYMMLRFGGGGGGGDSSIVGKAKVGTAICK